MEQATFFQRVFGKDGEFLTGEPEKIWFQRPGSKTQVALVNVVAFVFSFLVFAVLPLALVQELWIAPLTVPVCLMSTWFIYYKVKIRLVRSVWEAQEENQLSSELSTSRRNN